MVSVITVNYNNTAVTLELLESVFTHERGPLEVIVVDNGSRENPEQIIRQRYPQVVFVRSERNLGFAGGNNLGIAHATGDYLFFVNNDTEFTAPIIASLVTELQNNPRLGAVCPRLVYPSGANQFVAFTAVNRWTGRNACLTEAPVGAGTRVKSSFVHGAAFMISRALYEKIGNMREEYFLYFEELDWSAAMTRLGYEVLVLTDRTIVHKESQTVGIASELRSYFMARNRLLFMRRNTGTPSLGVFWLYYVLVASPYQMMRYLLHGQWRCARAHLAGIFWNIASPTNSLSLGYKYNQLNQL